MDYRDNRPPTRKGGPYCTPIWGPGSTPIYSGDISEVNNASESADRISLVEIFMIWVGVGLISLAANNIAFKTAPDASTLAGLGIILCCVAIGYAIYKLTRGVVPAVLWVSLVAMGLTHPSMPYAAEIASLTGRINFLALATPVISLAGLSVAKDLPAFRKLGWRIVVVSLAANAGTFLGGAFIAQLFLGSHA